MNAAGDVAGMLASRTKRDSWINAVRQFSSFCETTGVNDDLVEAIQIPLLRGRLMCNFKILHDLQERYTSKTRIRNSVITHRTPKLEENKESTASDAEDNPKKNEMDVSGDRFETESKEGCYEEEEADPKFREDIRRGHRYMRFATAGKDPMVLCFAFVFVPSGEENAVEVVSLLLRGFRFDVS